MPVTCHFHPDRDALYNCSLCGKPVCGDCMRFTQDDPDVVLCPDCTMESVLETSSEDFDQDEKRKIAIRRRALRAAARVQVRDVLNLKLLLLLLLMVGLNLLVRDYLSKSQPRIRISDPVIQKAGNPVLEMSLYLAAVFNYAADHDGKYPDSLETLYPDYVDKQEPKILSAKDRYAYAVDQEVGFVLSVPIADRFGFRKIYASQEGVIHVE